MEEPQAAPERDDATRGRRRDLRSAIEAFLDRFPAIGVYRFRFCAEEPISLPPYAGSAWRGLFGYGLRRTVCVTRQPTCEGCLLVGSCVYSTIFESPPREATDRARYNAVPHPYLVRIDPLAPREIAPGASLEVGIHLFGPAIEVLPYLVHAMTLVGARGIGRGHGRFRLEEVWQLPHAGSEWERRYEAGGQLERNSIPSVRAWVDDSAPPRALLCLETPLRMKRKGSLVGPRELELGDFLRQLIWRLNDLTRHHGGSDVLLEADDLAEAAAQVRVSRIALRWRDWTRYSSRQDTLMQLGGLVGELELEGEGLDDLWPLLALGQWTHLGKATTMGLGRYRLADAASLRDQKEAGETPTIPGVGAGQ